MLEGGVSLLAVTAFILTWVTVGVAMLPLEAKFLGKRFAVARNAVRQGGFAVEHLCVELAQVGACPADAGLALRFRRSECVDCSHRLDSERIAWVDIGRPQQVQFHRNEQQLIGIGVVGSAQRVYQKRVVRRGCAG